FWQRLHADQSGLALVEFAFSLPIFLGLGMFGTETAFLAAANTKVSQAALNLADNASRLGQTDTGVATPTITDSDILQVLAGTRLQTDTIDLLENGRVILSSLEVGDNSDGDPQQFIRWQRCKGVREVESDYGGPTTVDTADADFTGMGADGVLVQAVPGSAVMFVEIEYKYQPLFGNAFHKNTILRQEAAFNVRDDRNLNAGLFNDVGTNAATCNEYDAT
ncbi:MAG: pilus assembly protein TadE, partial [Sphingorhabdus sp.]|nr:pilus assembly protein TadE [Sphingorhabdus sp.]